jgi:hypothetical protein
LLDRASFVIPLVKEKKKRVSESPILPVRMTMENDIPGPW